jgi:ketosteroid isomerase-like protein
VGDARHTARDNEQLARETFEALARNDFEAWIEAFDTDVIYAPTREWPDQAPRRGRDRLKEFIRGIYDDWGVWELEVRKVHGEGERVLLETRIRAVGAQSGIELRGRSFHVMTIRDGRIVQMQDFIEPEEAERAAGFAI